jgi:hypothetical protein
MAALVAQGCSEIRWLATKVCSSCLSRVLYFFNTISCIVLLSVLKKELVKRIIYEVHCFFFSFLFLKMGAKPTTLAGLSGSGDIMLTCFVSLSRNRNVGLRLGSGEKLDEILNSMNQVCSIPSTA